MQRARCLRPANPLFFLALAATGRGDWFAADHLVTTDAKVPAQVRIPVPDAQDDDGSACTTADACKGGACQGGAVKACNDAEPCTADACEAKTGACTHDGAAQDGAACGGTCGHAAQACGKRFQAGWGGNANDDFAAIRASGSGWVAAGQTASYGSGGDGLLVAMDGCGTVQWSRTFGGGGKDKFSSLEPTPDGGWILAGESTTGDVSGDAWVVKVDGSGKKQWSLMHGGTGYDLGQSAVATSDGGYVVAAKTYSFGPGTPTLHNGLLFKLSGSGSVTWTKVLASNSGSMDAVQMREVKGGGYVLVGGSEGFGQGADDVWLTKLGADGSHVWSIAHGGLLDDDPIGFVQAADGGFVIAGSTKGFGATKTDVFVMKTDSSGKALWFQRFGSSSGGKDEAGGIAAVGDSFVVTGLTTGWGAVGTDAFALKINGSGAATWLRLFGNGSEDFGVGVAAAADGGVAMAGRTASSGKGVLDAWVVRAGADGAVGCQDKAASVSGVAQTVASESFSPVELVAGKVASDATGSEAVSGGVTGICACQ